MSAALRSVHKDDSAGAGFNIIARYTFWQTCDETFSLFVEGGAGVADFDKRTPGPRGPHFNFAPQGGFGLRYQFTDRLALIAAPRYLHISNAKIQGQNRNPGIDDPGGYVGVNIKF